MVIVAARAGMKLQMKFALFRAYKSCKARDIRLLYPSSFVHNMSHNRSSLVRVGFKMYGVDVIQHVSTTNYCLH